MLNKQSSWPFLKFYTSCDRDGALVPLQPEITSSGDWVRTTAFSVVNAAQGHTVLLLDLTETNSIWVDEASIILKKNKQKKP